MKILVVEDSRFMRRILRDSLEGGGYAPGDILETTDGVEALRLLHRTDYGVDLILLDWGMPKMDGITFLRRLRTMAPGHRIPAIMVTSQTQLAQVREALCAGARDYVVKPFKAETLVEKVRLALRAGETRKTGDTSVFLRAVASPGQAPPDPTFLSELPLDVMRRVCAVARVEECPAGEILVRAGGKVDRLDILVEGEVELLDPETEQVVEVRTAGDCLGEDAFLGGTASDLTARARTTVRVSCLDRPVFGDLLMEFPQLSYYVMRVVARYASRRNERMSSRLEEEFSGSLKTFAFPDLVQILHSGRKTGLLVLRKGEERAEIGFSGGEARHAVLGELQGEDAFYRALEWTDAGFSFQPGRRVEEATISMPTMVMLLEGMRRGDEAGSSSSLRGN